METVTPDITSDPTPMETLQESKPPEEEIKSPYNLTKPSPEDSESPEQESPPPDLKLVEQDTSVT